MDKDAMHMHIQIYTICTVASFVCGHLYLYVASFFGIYAYTNLYMHIYKYMHIQMRILFF